MHAGKLKRVFGGNPFTEKDIAKALKTTDSNAHYIRFKLYSNEKIVRIARGLYKFQSKESQSKQKVDPFLEMLLPHLKSIGKEFKFTGSSILCPYSPQLFRDVNTHLLYVEKGAAREFQERLESLNTAFTLLINPRNADIRLLQNKAGIRHFIIIREKNYFYSAYEGKASLESAFVDFYFEITRNKIPCDNFLTQLYLNLQSHNLINISTLTRYAKERGLKAEMVEYHERHEKTLQILRGELT